MSNTIRIAHITDTHLGFRALGKNDPATGRNQRTVDFEHALERTIDDILKREVDAILHAGDVFHHTRPTWQTLRHFIQQFRRLEKAGIPTLVIAGNHDTPRIRTGGSAFSVLELALPEIRFVAEYEDLHEIPFFGDLNLHVHAVPHGALTNDDPVVPQVFEGRRNILVCHGMVPGILDPGMSAEPGEQILNTALLTPEFDYIALGHYHLHMEAVNKGWYAGSIERTGWGDRDATPGYCIVEMDAPGDDPRIEHIDLPVRPMIDLKPVYGDGLRGRDIADKVLAQLSALNSPDAMTRVAIRHAERADKREAESILRRESVEYVWNLSIASERSLLEVNEPEAERSEEFPDLRQLFATFVAQRKGTHFSDEFAAAFLERGDRALSDALIAQEAPAPEEDALS
jgi:DNA repair exonuclease SbcCD nuclease subunit